MVRIVQHVDVGGGGTLMVQVVLFEEECYRYCTILIPFCILFIADAPE